MHQEADECSNIYTHPPLLFPAHPTSGGSAILHSRKRQAQRDEECHEMIIFADEMAIAVVVSEPV